MSESEAIVTRIDGALAEVEVAAMPSACGKCGDRGHCGKPQAGPRRYALPNAIGAQAGDRVVVCIADGAVLKAAVLSYLMPLVFVIAGAAAATAWIGEGLPAVAGAVSGLCVGLAVLRLANANLARGREPALALRLKRPT